MSCNGCDHAPALDAEFDGVFISFPGMILPGLGIPSDPTYIPPKAPQPTVNSINPGAAVEPAPPAPFETYPAEEDPLPIKELESDADGTSLTLHVTRCYIEGWNGSCGPDGEGGCTGTESCSYRVVFDLEVRASKTFTPSEEARPPAPTFPPSLTMAAPNGTASMTEPDPEIPPLEATATSSEITANGAGTLYVRPIAPGSDYWVSVRAFPYIFTWTCTPTCPTPDQENDSVTFEIDFSQVVFAAAGYSVPDPTVAPEDGQSFFRLFAWCTGCEETTTTTTGQGSGKNKKPTSITNQQL